VRVALVNTVVAIPGGHLVQVEQTARYLAAAGVTVVPVDAPARLPKDVEVAHVFCGDLDTIRQARQHRIPVVVTPVYQPEAWSYQLDGQVRGAALVRRRAHLAARLARDALADRHVDAAHELIARSEHRRMVYESADLLLPNSDGEARQIATELGVTTPMTVVPNGVDTTRFAAGAGGDRQGVLCVGRFEPHKNQLGLIAAMQKIDADLTLVGPTHPHHGDYLERCRRAGGARVTFRNEMTHDELPDLYAATAVHALPSWFETTGLSSLEAAAAGCTIVTTSRGHAREYFADDAYYCDPADHQSLTISIEAALRQPKPSARQRVINHYDWSVVAAATAAAYKGLLA